MKFCQTFSMALVALALTGMSGCATVGNAQATGLNSGVSPIGQAMQAPVAGFSKRGQ
jgi:hypothetical protein